jgi:hypothetical protein
MSLKQQIVFLIVLVVSLLATTALINNLAGNQNSKAYYTAGIEAEPLEYVSAIVLNTASLGAIERDAERTHLMLMGNISQSAVRNACFLDFALSFLAVIGLIFLSKWAARRMVN